MRVLKYTSSHKAGGKKSPTAMGKGRNMALAVAASDLLLAAQNYGSFVYRTGAIGDQAALSKERTVCSIRRDGEKNNLLITSGAKKLPRIIIAK